MGIAKELYFDLFMAKIKDQTQKRIFDVLAKEAASLCGVDAPTLLSVFEQRLSERTFGMGDGVAIFDVKSSRVQVPVLTVLTFENDVDFNALDSKSVNIMAAVISPQSCGPVHLQRLASVSRVLRSQNLCAALRDARDVDAMRVLFMPTQDWMVAA